MSFSQLKDFVSRLDDITFLSSISSLDCYNHNMFLKPFFWKLMIGTFKKTLNDPTKRAVASLCHRLKEVYFHRLGSVSQTSFVKFFQNRIYSKVYVFSKILLSFYEGLYDQEEYKDPVHDQIIDLPLQTVSEIVTVPPPQPIDYVQRFIDEYPFKLVDGIPNDEGKYLVYLDDGSQVYEDLNVYYHDVQRDEIVKRSIPKKKKNNKKKVVSIEYEYDTPYPDDDAEWEDYRDIPVHSTRNPMDDERYFAGFDSNNDYVEEPPNQQQHLDDDVFQEYVQEFVFYNESSQPTHQIQSRAEDCRTYSLSHIDSAFAQRDAANFADGLHNFNPNLSLAQVAFRLGYEAVEQDDNFEGHGTFE